MKYLSSSSIKCSLLLVQIFFLHIFLAIPAFSAVRAVQAAQSGAETWSQPENLSLSGAASQPRIVSGLDEKLQVFWIDRFDGLVSSVFDGESWSKTQLNRIPNGPPGMPYLVADRSGWVHAFWKETKTLKTNTTQITQVDTLFSSKMLVGGSAWTAPEILAEDALDFAVYAPGTGGLTLAYIRRVNNETSPAGVYLRQLASGADGWGQPKNIYTSIYYRLLSPGNTSISVANDSDGNLFVIWSDLFQTQPLVSQSTDYGIKWSTPELFGDSLSQPTGINSVAMPGSSLVIWQAANASRCTLFQQNWLGENQTITDNSTSGTPTPEVTVTPTVQPTSTPSPTSGAAPNPAGDQSTPPELPSTAVPPAPSFENTKNWGNPEQIFPNLDNCPAGSSFFPEPADNRIYWVWGEGTSSLSLAALDAEKNQWSIPVLESFSFEDPQNTGLIILSDLHSTITNNRMAVAGSDPNGEIWVTRMEQPVSEIAYAPPPVWSVEQPISGRNNFDPSSANQNVKLPTSDFSLVMDQDGRAHLVFAEKEATSTESSQVTTQDNSLGAALLYSYWTPASDAIDQMLTNKVDIFPSAAGEFIRQPKLLVDQEANFLHLVWSGGEQGEIFYSRAPLDKADTPSEWFPAQTVSTSSYAVWPQIGSDENDHLYLLYTIPLNEERGFYLTTSQDKGQTWSVPEQVIDAATLGLQALDHPSLYVTPQGVLHLAWVETALGGNNLSQGIFYSSSTDKGITWSEPVVLAGPGNDWPKLVSAAGALHLLYAQTTPRGGLLWQRSAYPTKLDITPLDTTPVVTTPPTIEDNATAGTEWSSSARVPGMTEVSLPYGVSVSGAPGSETIHLAGISPINGSYTYSAWKDGQWSTPESYTPSGARATAGSGLVANIGDGLQAASRPEGGTLAIVSRSISATNPMPALSFINRVIDSVEIIITPTPIPSPTATPVPQPTPTKFIPTPTPDLNRIPPPDASAQSPLIIAGVLAGVLVIAFFMWRIIRGRR